MTSKKALVAKYTPLQIIRCLESKHKTLKFEESVEEARDKIKNMLYYTVTMSLKGYPSLQGKHADFNKQKAR